MRQEVQRRGLGTVPVPYGSKSFPGFVPRKSAHAVFLDRQGTLWVATEDTLVFLPSGARRFHLTGIAVGQILQIAQAANGKLWIAKTTRSVRTIPLSDQQRPADETEIKVGSAEILFDRDGALWITTIGDGLRRSPTPELLTGRIKEFSTEVESFTAKDGFAPMLPRHSSRSRRKYLGWNQLRCGSLSAKRTWYRSLSPSSLGMLFWLPEMTETSG